MDILKTIKLPILIALLLFGPFFARPTAAQPGASVPIEAFYDELAPYGQWAQYPGYGDVWLPNVGPDFQPYSTSGHWIMTEYGNTWVSDYAWGWAPFHYGRWMYDSAYGGWLWLPGSDWAPAWVSWRSGGGYYGWAPLGPGVNININIPAPYWTFVPQVYFNSPSWYSYSVPRPRLGSIYQNSTIINNYYQSNNRSYNYGPPRGDIERITRQSVPVYRIDQMNRPGRSVVGNGSVGFYNPRQGRDNGQAYGRNDQFNNSARPDYNTPSSSNRGGYNTDRGYNGSNTMPNRGYGNGNSNNGSPDRGNYGGNYPADRNGNAANGPNSNPGNYNRSQSDRSEPSRGSYSPGNTQPQGGYSPGNAQPQGGYSQPSPRSEQPGQSNSQPTPGERNGGSFGQTPDNRGAQNQPRSQEQSQRSNTEFNSGGRGQRGPR